MIYNGQDTCRSIASKCGSRSLGLLVLRLAVGAIFIYAGVEKFKDMSMTIGYFNQIGLSASMAYFVATLELVGGLAIAVGLFTCFFGTLLSFTMLVATILTITKANYMMAQLPLITLGATLAISIMGSGRYTLGRCCTCCKDRNGCEKCKVTA